jgi:hypothetical protein
MTVGSFTVNGFKGVNQNCDIVVNRNKIKLKIFKKGGKLETRR